MNRSLRLLRPTIGRPIAPLALSRSAILTSQFKSPIFPSGASSSKLPVLYAPKVLGVRLYVTPSSVMRKEEGGAPKERGIVGNAMAEVCTFSYAPSMPATTIVIFNGGYDLDEGKG